MMPRDLEDVPASSPTPTTPAEPAPSGRSPGPGRLDWRSLHLWQIQPVRDLLVIAIAVGVVWLGYRLSLVTVPMLLALLLAYLLEPVVRRLTYARRGRQPIFSRAGAAAMLILVAGVLVVTPAAIGVGFAAVQGANYVVGIADNAAKFKRALDDPTDTARRAALPKNWRWLHDKVLDAIDGPGDHTAPPADQEGTAEPFRKRAITAVQERTELKKAVNWATTWIATNADQLGKQVLGAGTQAAEFAARGAGSLGFLLFSGFLTAFFFFFFCTGYGTLQRFWESLIPERKKGRVIDLVAQMDRVIAGFVRGRLTICAILIVFYTTAYAIIGMPAWTVVGPIVGLLTLVPYAAAAAVPVAMLLLWLNADGTGMSSAWWFIVAAPVVCLMIQQALDDYILTPTIQGNATGMDTPSILFASLAGGLLAGFYGLLLAIPVAACVKILLKELFWPRVKAWAAGQEEDILPISRG